MGALRAVTKISGASPADAGAAVQVAGDDATREIYFDAQAFTVAKNSSVVPPRVEVMARVDPEAPTVYELDARLTTVESAVDERAGGFWNVTPVQTADYTAAVGEFVQVDRAGAGVDVTVSLPTLDASFAGRSIMVAMVSNTVTGGVYANGIFAPQGIPSAPYCIGEGTVGGSGTTNFGARAQFIWDGAAWQLFSDTFARP